MASEHSALINDILDFLKVAKIGYCWKNNTGAVMKNGHWLKYGLPGSADILGICYLDGKFIGIEAKVGEDKQSSNQVAFEDIIRKSSGHFIVAKCLDDVVNYFHEIKSK